MDEEVIVRLINRRMEILQEHILNGRSPDYPTYRALVGAYVELRALENDIEEHLRRIHEDDEDTVDGKQ